jgi:4'-phosphopantetheinyl transferase
MPSECGSSSLPEEAVRLIESTRAFWPGDAPDLAAGEAHVWIARLDALDDHADATTAILDDRERARAANFRFDRDRQLYILGRMTLRRILAAYLDIMPAEVLLRAGHHGKPELGPPFGIDALHFNVSHSGDVALYAFTRDGPIGVDVEQTRALPDLDGLADLVLSPREKAIFHALAPTDRQDFFQTAWARKEAYLKALGDGLMRSPTSIEFGALLGEPGETIHDLENSSAGWRVVAWQPMAGYRSALVTTKFTRSATILDLRE